MDNINKKKYDANYDRIFGKKPLPKGGKFRIVDGVMVPIAEAPVVKATPNGDTVNVTNVGVGITPDRLEDVYRLDPQARQDVDFSDPGKPKFKNMKVMERHIRNRGWDPDQIVHG